MAIKAKGGGAVTHRGPSLPGCSATGEHCEVWIDGVDSQRRFLQEIGIDGPSGPAAAALLKRVRATAGGAEAVTTSVRDDLAGVVARATGAVQPAPSPAWPTPTPTPSAAEPTPSAGESPPGAATQAAGAEPASEPGLAAASSGPLAQVARILDAAALDLTAVNDVYWDEVVAIVPDGVEEVFDATVLGTHNFVANGIAVHNSIEQDADVVILLHKDKEREGEADVLVVKHRNGPTKDIVLGFQGHYARFANMAPSF